MLQCIDSIVKNIKEFKDEAKRKEILRYAIISEAKHNNDLSEIICRSNANKMGKVKPKIFNQFSVSTSELLLMLGIPAYVVLGDKEKPTEKIIQELGESKATLKLFREKNVSELYEFYIRKCNLLKSLYYGESLYGIKISLYQRCKNIEHATRELIKKCEK